ncbi:hypothetical protein OUZ56_032873 [Daphnia magna]|uniref:ATP-dependent DNA helicase n=1 Tax=Daphnia magna TaxID=35525 RepID=A0ABR0B9S5_9CRUS|nr:hypothetical protein OUZ56_032873 [Daphnia magna]
MAEKNLPFGGLAVLIVGDMFQFPPVDGTALYTSTADLYLRNRKLDPATTAGVQYFVTFRRIILQQQMRFTNDAKHMTLINKLRQENPPMSEILVEIENDYQVLSRELAQSDPLFALSPIVVTSNNEGTSINKSQSKVKQSEINSLYLHDDSLTRYFVENAPRFITENIKPERGLVNSTAVTYHLLVLNDDEDRERIAEQLMCSASKEDIALQYPPKYINVCVDNANKDDFVDMTVVPDQSNGGPERAAIPAKRLLQRTTSIAVKSETSPPLVQNAKSTRHNRTELP